MASHDNMDLHRRAVIGGMAASALAAGQAEAALDKVSFAVPAGACDCHHHIYDKRWPYAKTAVLKPPPATLADYRKYQAKLGTSRSVAVTPSTYAFDNDPAADFIAAQWPNARGVAVVKPDIDAAALKKLHAAGFRGARLQTGAGNPLTLNDLMPLARKIASQAWHMQLNLKPEEYVQAEKMLLSLPVDLVVDHMAGIPGEQGVKSPAYTTLRRLMDVGHTWVKLSSPDSGSKSGPPGYADRIAIASALAKAAPDRCLWASNWPFPSADPKARPDPVLMLEIMKTWAPDPALRQRILVDNPERCYGFDSRKRPNPPKT
ncbi:MAG: amidohydrolase family protein [Alphaproteobacteria bacterium]|nr:amidohydrolase family protein [Alphaproteobacteria bacterium]